MMRLPLVPLVVALVIALATLAGASPVTATSTSAPNRARSCDGVSSPLRWLAALDLALDLLPSTSRAAAHSRWTVLDPVASRDLRAFARTTLADSSRPGRVRVSVLTPCWVLPSLVLHEAEHVDQALRGLTRADYDRDALRYERAADRAAQRRLPLVWPGYHPFLGPTDRATP